MLRYTIILAKLPYKQSKYQLKEMDSFLSILIKGRATPKNFTAYRREVYLKRLHTACSVTTVLYSYLVTDRRSGATKKSTHLRSQAEPEM